MCKTDENEREIQCKLVNIINKDSALKNQIETITYKTDATERIHRRESNYAFLKLIEPLLKGKKVLDLFCGTNSIKQFSAQNNTNAIVTGVDNSATNTYCDIKSDVIDLPKVLKPRCQFDIIASFGGTNSENYSDDYNYLDREGILIHGYSDSFFIDNDINRQLNNDKKTKKSKQITKLLKYFQPIIIINVKGVHQIIKWPSQNEQLNIDEDIVYLIFRKKPKRSVLFHTLD